MPPLEHDDDEEPRRCFHCGDLLAEDSERENHCSQNCFEMDKDDEAEDYWYRYYNNAVQGY